MIKQILVDIDKSSGPVYALLFTHDHHTETELLEWVKLDSDNRSYRKVLKEKNQCLVICNNDIDLEYLITKYAL